MLIHWAPNPIMLDLGFIQLRWYGLLFSTAFLVGLVIFNRLFKDQKKDLKLLDPLMIYAMVGVVVGARLGHCLFYETEYYLRNPIQILYVWKGGLASHGAAIGMLTALFLFAKRYKDFTFLWLLDHATLNVAMGGGLIRLGNLINSEIIGKPTGGDWGFIFGMIDQVPRHPAQAYESFFYFNLFVLLWLLYRKGYGQKTGLMSGVFFTGAFAFRFLVEFLKENQSLFENELSYNMGQWLSIPAIMIGVGLIIYSNKAK